MTEPTELLPCPFCLAMCRGFARSIEAEVRKQDDALIPQLIEAPTYQQVIAAWNAQADEHNQWGELGEDEKIEWAVACAKAAPAPYHTPTSGEDLYWRLHGLSKALEGSGLIDESQHPDAYSTILDAMAFVRGRPAENLYDTQAQAGAVPLTHDEALDAFCRTPGIYQFVQAFMAGVRFAEQHHGIGIKDGDGHGLPT